MNVYDSDLLRRRFLQDGYRPVETPEEADIILVNSCGIRQKAEARAWNRVTRYSALKDAAGLPLVVLCGCVASREGQGLGDGHKGKADLVAGCGSYDALLPAVAHQMTRRENGRGQVVLEESLQACYEMPPVGDLSPLKAFVSISRGCDSHCAYCVVPSARGPHRSRPLEEIVEEAHELVEAGTREVTLLGQNVNVYGWKDADFVRVLAEMENIPNLWRVRFTSPHPRDMTPGVLEFMGRSEKVCEHLHLPLQSGCDETLSAMKRGYTTAQYRELVEIARDRVPGLAVTTDLMVGFPGETDQHFEAFLKFVEAIGFDAAFTFKYSPRPGTPAASFADHVCEEIKADRLERLIEVQNRSTDSRNRQLVGEIVEVLVEGRDQRDPGKLSGRTRANKLVSFEGDMGLVGTRVMVRIESAGRWTVFGRRLTDNTRGGGLTS
jgi:tRNA-2-methylthio-N6-dimethylallyladenosine synthase